jgi:hypothetical protein
MVTETESPKARTCKTCACSWVIEPPAVPTAAQLAANPNLMNQKPVRICRLNPPVFMTTTAGAKLMQQPVEDYFVCWNWKPIGTQPGDPACVIPVEPLPGNMVFHESLQLRSLSDK